MSELTQKLIQKIKSLAFNASAAGSGATGDVIDQNLEASRKAMDAQDLLARQNAMIAMTLLNRQ